MNTMTALRSYHFIAGLLANQQQDTLCSNCKAFTNTAEKVQQEVMRYTAELKDLPEKESIMLADIRMLLNGLHPVPDAVGQKKAGNCKLPQGTCFVKSSRALQEKLEQGP